MGSKAGAAKTTAKRKTSGRPKGSVNKFTTLKDSFLKAYQSPDGFGGDKELMIWAKDNKREFLHFLTKLFPKDIKVGPDEGAKELLTVFFPPQPKTVEEWQKQYNKGK